MSKVPRFPAELIEFFRSEGRKGGKATARKLSKAQRQESARRAAQARWAKAKKNKEG
jgi:hypothetical protein